MKRNIFFYLILTLCVVFNSFGQSTPNDFFDLGNKALEENDYITAIAEFTHVLSMEPENGEAYFLRARAKNDLAHQIGFSDTELCNDLVSALNYGRTESMDLLESNCMDFCFTMKNAFYTPENVFCADLSSSVLYDLPENLGELTQLVKLNLYNNKMTSLSDNLSMLNHLVDLDVSSNSLSSVSPSLTKLKYLHLLNLNKNEIRDLPAEFGNLQNLKSLYIRNNYLETMPIPISRLKNLEVLDLSLNQLTSLPIEIANLKNLKELILVGNSIAIDDQKRIKALLPNTTIYFDKAN